ncbi:DUF2000 family protein [Ruania zhangjianzhongii]|uniref:DUF2000 family protein n=1 Tax=Ruania zhangjianzhongii TaxID=2603206 RepID=UPI0011C87EB2|nr:DUF2000 family protein [Ruania zhangjianzhongii]
MDIDAAASPVRFDTKVAVLLRDDLLSWQELNVTAFLMSGIATSAPDLVGEPYLDGDDNEYLSMLRQPILVFTAEANKLAEVRRKAVERDLSIALYTHDLFATGHDAANRAAVAAVPADELDLVGLALRGPRNVVDRMTKGVTMHH